MGCGCGGSKKARSGIASSPRISTSSSSLNIVSTPASTQASVDAQINLYLSQRRLNQNINSPNIVYHDGGPYTEAEILAKIA